MPYNKRVKLNNENNMANSKEASDDGKLTKHMGYMKVLNNDEIDGKTREDVLVEKLNEMKEKNIKFRRLVEVKEEIQRILDEVYKFQGRPNFASNKISRISEYKDFINCHLLESKYNHISVYFFIYQVVLIKTLLISNQAFVQTNYWNSIVIRLFHLRILKFMSIGLNLKLSKQGMKFWSLINSQIILQ